MYSAYITGQACMKAGLLLAVLWFFIWFVCHFTERLSGSDWLE